MWRENVSNATGHLFLPVGISFALLVEVKYTKNHVQGAANQYNPNQASVEGVKHKQGEDMTLVLNIKVMC